MSNQPNYAENQEIWDKGQPSLLMCYRKGQEHQAYGWCSNAPSRLSEKQQAEYHRGYDDGIEDIYNPPGEHTA